MLNIEIEKMQTSASLYSAWEKLEFLPLSIQLEFRTPNGCVDINSPNGQYPSNEICKAFSSLLTLYPRWEESSECELFLCLRNDPSYRLGHLASVKGKIDSLISCLGWSIQAPVIDVNVSIEEQLSNTSNNYLFVEVAAEALGLSDLVSGDAPVLPSYPGVSFVIPGRGIHDTIVDVIQSIEEAVNSLSVSDISWECIIIDDANEQSLDTILGTNENIRIVRANTQVYCGGARNLGCEAAKYKTIFFLDGDTMVSSNFIREHLFRQLLAENLITVSLREYLTDDSLPAKNRKPDISKDTRMFAHYSIGRLGHIPVQEDIDVEAIKETNEFREFGFGRTLGPVDLPFMVKGNNLVVSKQVADIGFPPDFVGYGPEDGTFAAKAISRGCFVIPILSTGVFHKNHPPRSGSLEKRDHEFINNLYRMQNHLRTSAWGNWEVNCE